MSERNEVRNRVLGTLMLNAVLRWESFVTLLITAILFISVGAFPLLGTSVVLPAWFWLVLGGAAEGALIWSTLTDPDETQDALARDFESKYDLAHIRSSDSRERLRSALEYRRNMLKLVKQHSGAMRLSLRQTVDDINDWIAQMYNLAEHIDSFDGNDIVIRDLRTVPQKIERTKTQIQREEDERVLQELERQLSQLERQKTNLEQTQNSVRRAKIQLDSTLSSLGTIYAQMSLLGTKSETDSARGQRLRLEIQDEVNSLQDTIEAMDEVQLQSLNLR